MFFLHRVGVIVTPSPGAAFIIASTSSIINPIICPGMYRDRLPKQPFSPCIATSRGSLIRRPPLVGGAEHHTSVSPGASLSLSWQHTVSGWRGTSYLCLARGVLIAVMAAVSPCRAVSHPRSVCRPALRQSCVPRRLGVAPGA